MPPRTRSKRSCARMQPAHRCGRAPDVSFVLGTLCESRNHDAGSQITCYAKYTRFLYRVQKFQEGPHSVVTASPECLEGSGVCARATDELPDPSRRGLYTVGLRGSPLTWIMKEVSASASVECSVQVRRGLGSGRQHARPLDNCRSNICTRVESRWWYHRLTDELQMHM